MYGPWSDERLSAFEFNSKQNLYTVYEKKPLHFTVTENDGSAALGFSPCYDCPIAYQLKVTDDNNAEILVNGTVMQSQTISGILR